MPRIALPGFDAHYLEAGSGPDVLVLLHGNFASARWWRDLLADPPPGLRLLAPDLRGCGESERPGTGYELEQLVHDLEAFVDGLDCARLHLVGHSLGGSLALAFALAHPARVASLLLLTPGPADGLPQAQHSLAVGLFGVERIATWLPDIAQHGLVLARVLPRVVPNLPDPALYALLTEDALAIDPRAVTGFTQALAEWNALSHLPGYPGRVIIVGGGLDPLVPTASLAATAAALPNALLTIWPDVGHAPQLERPERFRALLAATLANATPEVIEALAPAAGALEEHGVSGWLHGLARSLGIGS